MKGNLFASAESRLLYAGIFLEPSVVASEVSWTLFIKDKKDLYWGLDWVAWKERDEEEG